MSSPKPLTAVLTACCLLTACAASKPPTAALREPLPAALLQNCPQPAPVPAGGEMDAITVTLKTMYDLYGQCAGQHVDLVDWLERER